MEGRSFDFSTPLSTPRQPGPRWDAGHDICRKSIKRFGLFGVTVCDGDLDTEKREGGAQQGRCGGRWQE